MAPPPATTEASEVIFRILNGPSQMVNDVRIAQPELKLLRRRSLVLRKLMDEESSSQKKIIPLQLDPESHIDGGAIAWVLNDLQRQGGALRPNGECNPMVLAKHCAVLWNYHCDPDQFKHLANSIQPRSSRPSSSPSIDQQSIIAPNAFPSIDQQSTIGPNVSSSIDQQSTIAPNASPSGSSRCWQGKRNNRTCGQLITIAIVLGLEDILEEEIKVAVWGTNKEVEILVPFGKDIKALRREELAKLFDNVYEAILDIGDDNEKLAKRIRTTFKEDGLGNFSGRWKKHPEQLEEWTPYDFLRGIEYELTGSTQPQTQSHEAQSLRRGRDVPDLNMVNLLGKVMRKMNKTLKPVINGVEVQSDREQTNGILKSLETFIGKRQQQLAADLMKWRDEIVGGWKEELARLDALDQKEE